VKTPLQIHFIVSSFSVTIAMSKERTNLPKERKLYKGHVKAVPSGDTVVLIELDNMAHGDQPPPEIELTLAGIQAPLLSRGNSPEQPWAWESREFLRRLCIGKKVQYTVNYRAANRCYGEIYLKGDDVRLLVIQAGWAQIRRRDDDNKQAPRRQIADLETLLAEEEKAKKAQIGIWNPDKRNAVRHLKEKSDIIQLFTTYRNKPLHAIVENVNSGTTLRLYLVDECQYINLNLSGAHSPQYRYKVPEEKQEPFANSARFFTEGALLHKDVDVILEAIDEKYLYGTVLYNGKNIALELLRLGLARFVDWTAKSTRHYGQLKKAAEEAQKNRLRIWKNFDAQELPSHSFEFTGKVVNIVNIGTFEVAETITDKKTGHVSIQKYKITLSAVKVPQLWSKEELEKTKDTKEYEQNQIEAAYAWEAREYLRKKLIGKKVRCVQDYVRRQSQRRDGKGVLPEKDFWSIYLIEGDSKVNIALDLIMQGYATLIPIKEPEIRPADYSQMVVAQEEARKAGKGIHSPKTKGATLHINDLSFPKLPSDLPKLKNMLSFLQRAGRKSAVVENVFNGCTMKLWIPSETCLISFGLQGLRCEKVQKSNDPIPKILPNAEGSKAYFFTKDNLHQYDVEVEVATLDKSGRFLGALFFNKKNFATTLLEEGWAFLNHPVAKNTPYYEEYVKAENQAKAAKKNHWEKWNPQAAEETRAKKENETEDKRQQEKPVAEMWTIQITEILDGCNFYFQIINDESKLLKNLEKSLRERIAQETDVAPFNIEKDGPLCAAQFSADNQWYRAEVRGTAKDGEFVIQYIDYGNMETVPNIPNRLRKLDPLFNEAVLPRQARPGKLAFVVTPQIDDEFGSDAAALFKELVWGKELLAKVHFVDSVTGAHHVFLGEVSRQVPINFALVRAGLARVERRYEKDRDLKILLEKLREEEENARNNRLNMWQYGVAPDEDEDEDDDVDNRRRRRK